MKFFLILGLVAQLTIISSVVAENVVQFYEGPFFTGQAITLTADNVNCKNLPAEFQSRASSWDAIGNARCGYIYELSDCRGRKVRLERFSWKALDFDNADLDNRVGSYRNCNLDGRQRIYINDNPNYQGKSYYLDLPSTGGCVTLAPPHDRIVQSIFLYDYCIIAYDGQYCNGRPIRLDATTRGIKDLLFYRFANKAKSFRLCYGVDVLNFNIEYTK